MSGLRICAILLAGVSPVSCDAAAPPKAPVKAVAKPAAPVVRAAPQSIGVFRLDRAPQQGSISRGTVPPDTIRLVMNGQDVEFAADGVVTLAAASPFTLEGNLLIIDHGMGLDSAFLHLSKIHVKVGDVVKQGQLVGAIGATGRASGPHLHWGMKWNQERIDPQPLAGPMPLGQ